MDSIVTIDFGGIPGFVAGSIDSLDYIQNYQGYAGFNWPDNDGYLLVGSTTALSSFLDSSHASLTNVASSGFLAYITSDFGVVTMTRPGGSTFDAVGGNFGGLSGDSDVLKTSIFWAGYRNGVLVASGNYLLGLATRYVAFNVSNVDTFCIWTNYYLSIGSLLVTLLGASAPAMALGDLLGLLLPNAYDPRDAHLAAELAADGAALDLASAAIAGVNADLPLMLGSMLTEWEAELGLTPVPSRTVAQREADVRARLVATTDPSITGFTGLAAALGCAIAITELRPFYAGAGRCGDALYVPEIVYVWRVAGPAAAAASAGLVALFEEIKPAHTFIVWSLA